VTDIVKQSGAQDEGLLIVVQLEPEQLAPAQEFPGGAHNADGMGESGVIGAGENQLRQAQLTDAPQALEFAAVD
jgi:hypothetical protein